jgi:catechol 2,3-dioxygenase-like lactoylglutathione lyase family enzyme
VHFCHLALAVQDEDRSRRFYERYFGFGARPPRRYPDGVLMLYNADGFALALGSAEEQPRLPRFLHFGFGVADPDDVRTLRDRLVADGVEIVEESEEPTYVSVKCRDPDGYVIETAWEVLEAPATDAGSGRSEGAS